MSETGPENKKDLEDQKEILQQKIDALAKEGGVDLDQIKNELEGKEQPSPIETAPEPAQESAPKTETKESPEKKLKKTRESIANAFTAAKEKVRSVNISGIVNQYNKLETSIISRGKNIKNFFGKKEKDLVAGLAPELARLVPEFNNLSEGQQLLVLQGLGSRLYETVIETANNDFKERVSRQNALGKIFGGSTRLGRTANAIGSIPTQSRKKYLLAKNRKQELRSLTQETDGRDTFLSKTGGELVHIIGESKLEARKSADGKEVVIQYLSEKNMPKNGFDQALVESYNRSASALSQIPYEWRLKSASAEERAAYREAKAGFENSSELFVTDVREKAERANTYTPAVEIITRISESQTLIETMSFLSASPDTSKKLRSISKNSALMQGTKDILFERAAISAQGGAARAVIGTAVGGAMMVAAPITGGLLGFFRGKARAKESFKEESMLARRGQKQNEKTAIRMSDVNRKTEQIASYIDLLKSETDEKKRSEILGRLKTYADFVERKRELGEINFGTAEGRVERYYTLMRTLHEATVALYVTNGAEAKANAFGYFNAEDGDIDILDGAFRARVRSFGKLSSESAKKARTSHVRLQAWRSAFYGALLGTAGAAAAHYFHGSGSHDVNHNAPVGPKQTGTRITSTPEVAATGTNTPPANPAPVAVPAASHFEHPAQVTFSSKGAGETVLEFRHSAEFAKLSPDMQKFFKGNIWEVVKTLKALTADGKSVSVGAGSYFGVNEHGNIFLADTHHAGAIRLLGHIENGKFVEGADIGKLDYISGHHAATETVQSQPTSGSMEAETSNTNARPVEQGTYVPDEIGNKTTEALRHGDAVLIHEAREDTPPPPEETREAVTFDAQVPDAGQEIGSVSVNPGGHLENTSDVPIVHYSDHQRMLIEKWSTQNFNHELDRYFAQRGIFGNITRHGIRSPAWNEIRSTPASVFMKQKIDDLRPEYRELFKDMQRLAAETSTEPGRMNLESYLRFMYEKEMIVDVPEIAQ